MAGFLGISWWIWGILACIVALIFGFYVPNREAIMATTGLQFVILRWFHSLVWVFLAASFFMRGTGNTSLVNLANPVAMLGGISYGIYMVTMLRSA